MKKSIAALAVISSLIVGCGSSSSESTQTATIKVERGPVLRAIVIDSKGQIAREVGNGEYQFLAAPTYPILATGGFIDVNRDGIVDVGDVNNTLTYYSQDGSSCTLVSTIAQNSDIREYLKTTFNLTDSEIDNDTPSTNDTIAAISDVIFSYVIENNISPTDLTLSDIESLTDEINERISLYNETVNKASLEAGLIERLGLKRLI